MKPSRLKLCARNNGIAERDVVRLLSEELDRGHRLVRAEGVRHLDGQRHSTYRFRHILFQKYLYTTLDAVERSHLHGAVASALQAMHGEQTDDVAAELARHFDAAGATDQAAGFLRRAATGPVHSSRPERRRSTIWAAWDAYERAYGKGWNPLEQVALEHKIGEALFPHGDYQEAAEHLQRAALGLLGIRLPEGRAEAQRAVVGPDRRGKLRIACCRSSPPTTRVRHRTRTQSSKELDISYLDQLHRLLQRPTGPFSAARRSGS